MHVYISSFAFFDFFFTFKLSHVKATFVIPKCPKIILSSFALLNNFSSAEKNIFSLIKERLRTGYLLAIFVSGLLKIFVLIKRDTELTSFYLKFFPRHLIQDSIPITTR